MDANGNPDMQDVREGTATVDPVSGAMSWLPGAAPVQPGSVWDSGISPDVVTVTAPPPKTTDGSVMAFLLVLVVAGIAFSD